MKTLKTDREKERKREKKRQTNRETERPRQAMESESKVDPGGH